MTQPLPDALQPWRPWLSWFAPELAAAVGELLKRLHPLLGRFDGNAQAGAAQPDGVGDLRNRGSYERLLSSEWLLATELPDEFLRRAAGGEHLFLSPRMRPRQADKLIVAVFDTGPWLLGAPRLAQLALWILLARRAADAGGELRWGAAHLPGQWHVANSAKDLRQLLNLRTLESAGESHWRDWSRWLAAHATGVGERWLVGYDIDAACRLPEAPSHAAQVRLGLDGGALELSLRSRGGRRAAQLPLPPAGAAEQLLRGRFQPEAPVDAHRTHPEKLSLTFAPVIASSGNHVAVPMLEGHGVMVFKLHRSQNPGRQQPKPQLQNWSAGANVLAVAFSGKSLCAVIARQDLIDFWQVPELTAQRRPPQEMFEAPPGRASLLAFQWHRSGLRTCAFLVDTAGRLVCWSRWRNNALASRATIQEGFHPVDTGVLAMTACGDAQVAYVCLEAGQLWLRLAWWAAAGGPEKKGFALLTKAATASKAFVSGRGAWNKGYASCAVRVSRDGEQERWRVLEASTSVSEGPFFEPWEAVMPPGAQAIGLILRTTSPGHALVVQEANRRGFLLVSAEGTASFYRAPDMVERVSVCPNSGLVAMLTRRRELHVYSTQDKSIRLVTRSGGAQPRDFDD